MISRLNGHTVLRALPAVIVAGACVAGAEAGGSSQTNPFPVSINSGEKPQSKLWQHDNRWFCVMPDDSGTWIWRLDGNSWTQILQISDLTDVKADTKRVGDVTHILLHQWGGADHGLVSVEYVDAGSTYAPWSQRPGTTPLVLDPTSETASFDIDSTGRLWASSESVSEVQVFYSDFPYNGFNGPEILADNITFDDISAVQALPNGDILVMWSDQNAKRFGARLHQAGDPADDWGPNEVPAGQSAIDNPDGSHMTDDHVNTAVAPDGTLYAAVKSSYDGEASALPEAMLLVRRPNGTWDDFYAVDCCGTRPIVQVNPEAGHLRVFYKIDDTNETPIVVYNESPLDDIDFGPQQLLVGGGVNNPSGAKHNWFNELIVLVTDDAGVVASGGKMTASVPLEGACCLGDSSCSADTEEGCLAAGGSFQGLFVSCASVNCPLPSSGACCFEDGSCEFLTEGNCNGGGGDFQGEGVGCGVAFCPLPNEGACCFPDGSCTIADGDDCGAQGGTFQGAGMSCGEAACPQPPAACCLEDGSCLTLGDVDCDAQGGIYQGSGSDCGAVACPQPGACCFEDGSCTFGQIGNCETSGGLFQGESIDCGTAACPQPGACCFDDGSCQVLSMIACDAANGFFAGESIDCGSAACPQPGACCMGAQACQVILEVNCDAVGGFFQGEEEPCNKLQCPLPCCLGAGDCQMLGVSECQGAGGQPQAGGGVCGVETCPNDPCIGDTNGDNDVSVDDLVNVVLGWGACGSGCTADVNSDGVQDVDDLILVVLNWGPCGGP